MRYKYVDKMFTSKVTSKIIIKVLLDFKRIIRNFI